MKKKIVTLLTLVILTVTSTFAGDNTINKNALSFFSAAFAKASKVKWEKENTYYRASFELNERSYNALFSLQGDIIAVSRNILSTELPADLKASFPVSLSGYWITDLVKYAVEDDTRFFATIENGDEKIILESIGESSWSVLRKTTK